MTHLFASAPISPHDFLLKYYVLNFIQDILRIFKNVFDLPKPKTQPMVTCLQHNKKDLIQRKKSLQLQLMLL